MKILNAVSSNVKTDTYEIETKYGIVIYIEYINDKSKLIDCELRGKNTGEMIDDAVLLEEIQEMVNTVSPLG